MIRFAENEDIPTLLPLLRKYHNNSYLNFIPLDEVKMQDQVREFVNGDRKKKIFLIETKDDQIVGFIVCFVAEKFFSGWRTAYEMVWEGSPRLFAAFEYWAKLIKVNEIITSSPENKNERLSKFYEKKGYVPREYAYAKVLHGN